jgi:hypothetical protein
MDSLLISVDGAAYDEPEAFLVSVSPRVLRALALLLEAQEFFGDGSVSFNGLEEAGDRVRDEEFIDHVCGCGADAAQIDELRQFIDTEIAASILGRE